VSLTIPESAARLVVRVLTDALARMTPGIPLCAHHAGTMRHWRDTHPHEETEGYQRRCEDIARQCCQTREDQP
jgi:hypothetical protein